MSKDDWREIVPETSSEVWGRGKPIEGVLVSVKENVGPNESMLYTLKTESGEVAVWGSTVLDTKFAEIEKGSQVKIEPQGKVKSEKTGREYQDFKVFVKPPAFKEILGGEPMSEDEMPEGFLS